MSSIQPGQYTFTNAKVSHGREGLDFVLTDKNGNTFNFSTYRWTQPLPFVIKEQRIQLTDETYSALTVDDLRALLGDHIKLDDEGCIDEPGDPNDGMDFKKCWGAREDIERALYERAFPMRDHWWAL